MVCQYLVNMSTNDREDKIQVIFKLARDQWQRFQVKCKDNGASASQVLSLLIELYLREEIENYQTVLSLGLEAKINAAIIKHIKNKLDWYIDEYIEQKLIQEVDTIEDFKDSGTTEKNSELKNLGHKSPRVGDRYEYPESSMTAVIEKKEVQKSQLNDEKQELKTARELAKFLGCSPVYITTLNRLGDLEKRGWIDSGKRQGKAILYKQINI